MEAPSTPFGDGRDASGRFTKGNPGGPGNPHAKRVAALRSAMLLEVTPEDLAAIIRRLIDEAKGGNVRAAREVFERTLGKPTEADFLDRLEQLEEILGARHRETA